MNRPGPPALATWFMSTLLLGNHAEALIGDLTEEHRRGRSRAWYWRQAIVAIVTNFAAEIWQQKFLAGLAVALGTYLDQIYMFVIRPSWVAQLDRFWYPYLISSRWSWMAINPWAYRLQLYSLTGRVVYCALLSGCRLDPVSLASAAERVACHHIPRLASWPAPAQVFAVHVRRDSVQHPRREQM